MILDKLRQLNAMRLILASGSPRRKDILSKIGLKFEVIPSTFAEDLDKSRFTPIDYVVENARIKAQSVFDSELKAGRKCDLVIGSDTVVVFADAILEKPPTTEAAIEMLSRLSGETHQVVTGVALIKPLAEGSSAVECFSQQTEVTFAELTDTQIRAYVETGEPMDKAGGYGLQGIASQFVERISGCYWNVVGFPVQLFCAKLRPFLELDKIEDEKSDE